MAEWKTLFPHLATRKQPKKNTPVESILLKEEAYHANRIIHFL